MTYYFILNVQDYNEATLKTHLQIYFYFKPTKTGVSLIYYNALLLSTFWMLKMYNNI